MNIKSMYYDIANNILYAGSNKIPISQLISKYNFDNIKFTNDDEHFRAEKQDDTYKIVASIECFTHDRAFELRPDTIHNYLYLYEKDILIDSKKYMYED